MLTFITILKKYGKEIIIFLFAIVLLKNFKDVFSTDSKDELDSDKKLDTNTSNVTLTKTQVATIVENIWTAVNQVGTDEVLLYAQFDKMKSQDDFNLVFNSFGKRQYSYTWGNIGDPLTSDKHDLISILTNELNLDEQQYIRETYPYIKVF